MAEKVNDGARLRFVCNRGASSGESVQHYEYENSNQLNTVN